MDNSPRLFDRFFDGEMRYETEITLRDLFALAALSSGKYEIADIYHAADKALEAR